MLCNQQRLLNRIACCINYYDREQWFPSYFTFRKQMKLEKKNNHSMFRLCNKKNQVITSKNKNVIFFFRVHIIHVRTYIQNIGLGIAPFLSMQIFVHAKIFEMHWTKNLQWHAGALVVILVSYVAQKLNHKPNTPGCRKIYIKRIVAWINFWIKCVTIQRTFPRYIAMMVCVEFFFFKFVETAEW